MGQAGEFAVCAQLGKLGLIATPFAGNVPGFDVLAVDEFLNCVPIQVKTSRSLTWISGDISNYVEVDENSPKLILGEPKKPKYPDLIRVYVSLGMQGRTDRFFVLSEEELFRVVAHGFTSWLKGHGGVRPKNPASRHSAIGISDLESYENAWSLVTDRLKLLQEGKLHRS